MKVCVFIRRRQKVSTPVIVNIQRAVTTHITQRPKAPNVSIITVRSITPRHRCSCLIVVVAVFLMRPHHELPRRRAVHHLRPLNLRKLQVSVRISRQNVIAKLPPLKVFRPVARNREERIVPVIVAVLTEIIKVSPVLKYPSSVSMREVPVRIEQWISVIEDYRLSRQSPDKNAQNQTD